MMTTIMQSRNYLDCKVIVTYHAIICEVEMKLKEEEQSCKESKKQ